ncbi:beta strand repeat-containing protein, partial [Belliella pelovolcani]
MKSKLLLLIFTLVGYLYHPVQAQETYGGNPPIVTPYTASTLPSVTTDKDDYLPGETAIITGTGWIYDSVVDLHFIEDPFVDHIHDYHDIAVDEDGNFTILFPILERHLGVAFTLHAKGMTTGQVALAYFTDGNFTFSTSGLPNGQLVDVEWTVSGNLPQGGDKDGQIVVGISNTSGGANSREVDFTYITNPLTNGGIKYQILNYSTTGGAQVTSKTDTLTIFNSGAANVANDRTITANYGALISSNESAIYGSSVTLTSTFYSNYQTSTSISGKTITFYLDGTAVGTGVTNASGVASLTLDLTSVPILGKLNVGTYDITTSFAGDTGLLAVPKENSTGSVLTVEQKEITGNFTADNKVYDGNNEAIISNRALIGIVSGDIVTLDGGTATFSDANAGDNKVVTLSGATLTGVDAGNYILTSVETSLANIEKAPSTTVVTINGGPFTYTGSAIEPATVSVTGPGGLNLTPDAVYSNNINAGTATASYDYEGDDNYLPSSDSEDFEIGKATTVTTVTINGGPFTYTGSAIEPATVSVTGPGGLDLTPAADYANNINAGTATASYSYAGDDNYLPSSDSEDFEIGKATTVTTVTINGGPFTYTGSTIEPATVSVTGPGGLDLTPTADYANNINAGTATASYSYAGDANYLPSSDSEDFTIDKAATTTVVTINGGPFTYTGSAIEPATVSVTGPGGLDLTPTADYANNINAGTATASYSYAGDDNYLPSSDSEDFTIDKAATTTVVTINGGPFTYTGSAIEPATVSVTGPGGLNLTPDAVYSNNINAGTATASYDYEGDDNYLPSSDSEDFEIGKASTTTVVTINGGPFTYTGSAIEPATVSVTGPGG